MNWIQTRTSAASALRSLYLSALTNVDDGIRVLRRGLKDATTADVIAERLQRQTLADHDRDNMRHDTGMNNFPPSISDLLGVGWQFVPRSFESYIRHLRGSFPMAAKAGGTFVSAKQKKPHSFQYGG